MGGGSSLLWGALTSGRGCTVQCSVCNTPAVVAAAAVNHGSGCGLPVRPLKRHRCAARRRPPPVIWRTVI
eukprot:NODE_8716_length_370_cov_241.961905.p4 GENE.NODE_8716_length_370_cov_241.961905~~NODE_8716_length_370_cov_241.961905.p4  ORF type:complete len:70 (+),score=3.28 NODE_8716_length_370_cov_241.961905:3-212(+)